MKKKKHTMPGISFRSSILASLEDGKINILLVGISWVKFSWQAKLLCPQEVWQLRLLKFLCRRMLFGIISLLGILNPHMVFLICPYHIHSARLHVGEYQPVTAEESPGISVTLEPESYLRMI